MPNSEKEGPFPLAVCSTMRVLPRLKKKLAITQVDGLTRLRLYLWCQTVEDGLAVTIRYDEPCLTQDFEVMGKEALFDSKRLNERTDVRRLLHE